VGTRDEVGGELTRQRITKEPMARSCRQTTFGGDKQQEKRKHKKNLKWGPEEKAYPKNQEIQTTQEGNKHGAVKDA